MNGYAYEIKNSAREILMHEAQDITNVIISNPVKDVEIVL